MNGEKYARCPTCGFATIYKTKANPTPTGEPWTVNKLHGFYAAGELQEQQLVDAINAALAQLDAAVEALRRCHKAFVLLGDPQHANLIDAVLAKIGEGNAGRSH